MNEIAQWQWQWQWQIWQLRLWIIHQLMDQLNWLIIFLWVTFHTLTAPFNIALVAAGGEEIRLVGRFSLRTAWPLQSSNSLFLVAGTKHSLFYLWFSCQIKQNCSNMTMIHRYSSRMRVSFSWEVIWLGHKIWHSESHICRLYLGDLSKIEEFARKKYF